MNDSVVLAVVLIGPNFERQQLLNVSAHACRHIQNAKKYGIPVVIAINKFATDTDAELQAVKAASKDAGRPPPQLCCAPKISELAVRCLNKSVCMSCAALLSSMRCQCEHAKGVHLSRKEGRMVLKVR